MKNDWPTVDELRELCLRRCDTIFYSLTGIVAVARAIVDVQNGELSGEFYAALINAIGYRELIRLFLWAQENPRYAIASLYGAVVASAIPVIFTHPGALAYECVIYVLLRIASGIIFGLDEKQAYKLYVNVLFDYYNRNTPPRRPRKRRKQIFEASPDAWAPTPA